MAGKKRDYGAGSIDQRGEDTWRLRYRIGNDRFTRRWILCQAKVS
jgi:hypothetical protein